MHERKTPLFNSRPKSSLNFLLRLVSSRAGALPGSSKRGAGIHHFLLQFGFACGAGHLNGCMAALAALTPRALDTVAHKSPHLGNSKKFPLSVAAQLFALLLGVVAVSPSPLE